LTKLPAIISLAKVLNVESFKILASIFRSGFHDQKLAFESYFMTGFLTAGLLLLLPTLKY